MDPSFIPVRSWNSLPTELRTIKYKREKWTKLIKEHMLLLYEKIVVYQQNDTKTVFDSLFKLYEWDPDFVYSVCKSSLHFL